MVLSRIDQALEIERELTRQREMRKRMLRDWMKPRIKRVDGAWVCTGRGTTATGLGPWAAYSAWLRAQSLSVIYATKISAYDMALKVGPC